MNLFPFGPLLNTLSIHFKLKHPDKISPFGTEDDTTMHWFGLTDSNHWLVVGSTTLYEYTDDILQYSGGKGSRYIDYYLIRFVEDLTELFSKIAEPIPDKLYDIAKKYSSLYGFYEKATDWLEQLPDTALADFETYYSKYDPLIEWIHNRRLHSSHLQGGPHISFFRHGHKISLVWKSDFLAENQLPLWTAGNGECEMNYEDFIYQIEDFGNRFFTAMETQVALALVRDWGDISIDKGRLIEEQKERRSEFDQQLKLLKENSDSKTDWAQIKALIREMLEKT